MSRSATERAGARLLALLLPRYCGLCGAWADDRPICADCHRDLPWIHAACEDCGTPLAVDTTAVCGACQKDPPPFTRASAPLVDRFPVDAVIRACKFRRRQHLAPMLAAIALPTLKAHAGGCDALLPVPLSRWRHALRGFNQAHEIARHLARAAELPIRNVVRRTRHTRPQSGLDAPDRRRNVEGAFRVVRPLRCRHPLIVDDVMTTGETCRELSRTLLAAGAREVSVLTVARAVPPTLM